MYMYNTQITYIAFNYTWNIHASVPVKGPGFVSTSPANIKSIITISAKQYSRKWQFSSTTNSFVELETYLALWEYTSLLDKLHPFQLPIEALH